MNRIKGMFCLLLVGFLIQGAYAQNPSTEKKGWDRFQVEILGGLASSSPQDLNMRAEYDTQYLENQREFYLHYFPLAGQGLPSDEFNKLKSNFPLGFRFRYRLSRIFSISLGFKYLSKEQSSDVSAQYQWAGQRPYLLDYRFSPYLLSSRAYSPQLGVHLSFGNSKPLGFEYFLTGGPLFARCSYSVGISRLYFRNNNVINANETSYEIQGKSTGLSLNTGLRLNFRFFRSLGVFCEAGYAFQKAQNLQGPGSFLLYLYSDQNTKNLSDRAEWDGYWGINESDAHAPLPSNEWEKDDERVSDFELDISGMFLQLGISFSFSL